MLPTRRSRRRGITVAVLLLLAVLPEVAAAGTKDLSRYNVIQYNMWGTFSNGTAESPGLVNGRSPSFLAAWVIFTPPATRPLSISLNEVCKEAGYDYLVSALAPLGYSGQFLGAKSVFDNGFFSGSFKPWGQAGYAIQPGFGSGQDPGCRSFGNAVFVRNAVSIANGWWYSWQNLSSKEYRNQICLKTSFPLFWQCATHLAQSGVYNSRKIQSYQLDEYQGIAQSNMTGATVLSSGDFNLSPSELPYWWFSTMKESDAECVAPTSYTCEATKTGSGSKLDYVFRAFPSSWLYDLYVQPSVWCDPPTNPCNVQASDHKILVGYP